MKLAAGERFGGTEGGGATTQREERCKGFPVYVGRRDGKLYGTGDEAGLWQRHAVVYALVAHLVVQNAM